MVLPEQIKEWIETGLPGANATVTGDGHHFEAKIVYEGFQNKTMIQQHRMVYDALGDKMQNTIHALSMKTYPTDHIKEG
ncbi:MAG: BolA/IbaG family iron-sulfur metabolism protein [Gammaproteobacteria bacterium]|nr:BolA/IbaG family iron-sulfur metabolism protein [Gammaproteobacteria bacterium]